MTTTTNALDTAIVPEVGDTPPASRSATRLASIDAYRGFVMFLMMAEVLRLGDLAKALPESEFWAFLAHHQSHVPWIGCSLHDLIQPSFSFLVGLALPFSLASRAVKGQSRGMMIAHALWRAFLLAALGIFLRSMGKSQTNYTFEDTLTQIGLGYPILFVLGMRPRRDQWIALAVLLVGYWAAFALYPAPGPDFDFPAVGVPDGWPHHLAGFAAHWDKNSNLAWAFDTWFLNLFPRVKPFLFNGGGYATLSFLPTLATMILGLLAGGILKGDRSPLRKILWFVAAGAIGLASGWLLGYLGICPVVKRIWTPSWALFSGGWCFLLLAGFYALTDAIGYKGWAFPLIVIGANSIAAYVAAHVAEDWLISNLNTHLGPDAFAIFGDAYAATLRGAVVLALFWLFLLWMYRRRLFLKI